MITKHHSCDDAQLDVLLAGDETSEVYRSSAAHVETCAACQQRLTELAGDRQVWDDVAARLSDEFTGPDGSLSAVERCAEGPGTASDLHRLEELLDPPRHPEMLGRLGRYEIERVIGAGGMGVVLRGFDSELNRPVAVKVLARHLMHNGAARQRFARESRAAAAVVHEHVVAIHNVETSAKTPFLVMQYVAGESLQARVDRDGPLDAKEILRIGIQAAAGLQAAHAQGVIHRDVKPGNILLEHGVDRALVTDFGLARTVDDASLTHTGVITGTPDYMSPEQADGRPADQRTDLFSLGSVLYFMATGRPPFRAERAMGVLNRICHGTHRPAWEVNSDVPDELSDIIDDLLQKQPERRIATAADVQRRLTDLLARIQHRRVRRRPKMVRLARKHRRGINLAAAALVLTALAGWSLLGERGVSTPRWQHQPLAADRNAAVSTPREHHRGTNVPRSPAGQTFSVETWQMASEREAEQFAGGLRELNEALQRLESRAAFSDHEQTIESSWQSDIHQLNQQLQQLGQEPFP